MKYQLFKLEVCLEDNLRADDMVYASEYELAGLIDDLMADASTDDLDESDALLVRDCLNAALTKMAEPLGITGYENSLCTESIVGL